MLTLDEQFQQIERGKSKEHRLIQRFIMPCLKSAQIWPAC